LSCSHQDIHLNYLFNSIHYRNPKLLDMKKLNRLANASSPYLQQHASNPVDWYLWSEEAFTKAQQDNKPILLSIGYSACHWCHVMAEESFIDEETATVMNQLFVNIKVDREERPDIDTIYQTAQQMLTGRPGGWPLTAFLNPYTKMPYFIGTYFPKQARYQLPAFIDVLHHLAAVYHNRKSELAEQDHALTIGLEKLNHTQFNDIIMSDDFSHAAYQQIKDTYDEQHGGFAVAPKFPHPTYLQLLLQKSIDDEQALAILINTLTKMAEGGIYDHIGGGFYRYSVDEAWQIPHFEKMLYDNALLLPIYAKAYAITTNPLFKLVVEETVAWLMREMQTDEGGYYSSIDADSEHEEGKFYVWKPEHIQQVLTEKEYKLASCYFNLAQPANFEGYWHLHAVKSLAQVAVELNISLQEANLSLQRIKQKLLLARELRIHPHRDEKVLTAWNALMIKGMVIASQHLQNPLWLASAEQALSCIYHNLLKENRLLVSYKEGRANLSAYLDDYAFLIEAILLLLQARWCSEDLYIAQKLADTLLEQFLDKEQAGFFFTSNDHEKLLYRPKNLHDNVIPAGNSIAAYVLQNLGYLLAEPRYLLAAEKTLKLILSASQHSPADYASISCALADYLYAPDIIIIRGSANDIIEWKTLADKYYAANRLVFAIDNTEKQLPPAIASKSVSDKTCAYICQGQHCLSPIFNINEFSHALSRK
jgi:uncharacterized protein YyaL (SSP411 family)